MQQKRNHPLQKLPELMTFGHLRKSAKLPVPVNFVASTEIQTDDGKRLHKINIENVDDGQEKMFHED